MSKSIAIYGATGAVGSTFVTHLFNSDLLKPGDTVVLVGRGTEASDAALMAVRVDLLDAFDDREITIDIAGSPEEVAADLFVMAAGRTISPGLRTRPSLAAANAPIFEDTARRFASSSPQATVVVISNPVELGVAAFSRHFDRRQVVGMGAQQDSLRFARAIAARLGVHRSRIRASVLGEHGDAMVPIWSSVYVTDPDPALLSALIDLRLQFEGAEHVSDMRRAMAAVGDLLQQDRVVPAYQLVEAASPQVKAMVEPFITVTHLGSTPNATANAALAFVAAFVKADERKLHAQVLLRGEFCSIDGICGAPIQMTPRGWTIASHEPLTADELRRLAAASEATRYVFDFMAKAVA